MRPLAWVVLGLSVGTLFQGHAAKGEEGFAVVQAVRSNQLHLFAPVSVNQSKVMWFLVDTGAPKSLISAAVRKSLSLPSANGEQTVHLRGMPNTLPIVYAQSIMR
jgi:Aspartyl protease